MARTAKSSKSTIRDIASGRRSAATDSAPDNVASIRSADGAAPSLKALEPAAARWISTLIRVSDHHPAMTRILEVIERLQDRPFRTNFLLLGEPGTGKEGLARALHQLGSPHGPLVRLDVSGFPEEEALRVFLGVGKTPGVAEQAHGGAILIEETAALPARVQLALLRLLKTGRVQRVGTDKDVPARFQVNAVALTDRDLSAEVAANRFRHDLYYRLARIVLWLPPLRERSGDLGPAAIWMGNRILSAAGIPLEVRSPEDMKRATADERKRSIELDASALHVLATHAWPGNFRELETVMERALLLHRQGPAVGADEIRAALEPVFPPSL